MKRFLLYVLSVSVLVFAGCGDDNKSGGGTGPIAQPAISSMKPSQVSRGQMRVPGTITGSNLGGVTSVNLGEGITVLEFKSVNASEIEVLFSVAANASSGARTISVSTTSGNASSAAALTVSNNLAPTVKFSVSPDSGAKNTLFTFDATQSSDTAAPVSIKGYMWDFGDGKKDNGRVVTHKFNKGGSFQVTLTVTDNNNAANSVTRSIEVANGIAPVPRYTSTPPTGDVDTRFRFDASPSTDGDGSIVRYEWKFGDGARASGPTVEHKYSKDGVYAVELTVTDNDGLESALRKELRVEKFDESKAIALMSDVVAKFFARYSKLDTLPADRIVEDWSESPDCTGRDREIKIIQEQQTYIAKTQATIIGDFDVYIKPDHLNANLNVLAEFKWTEKSGKTGQGIAEHDFAFRLENGRWMICNFQLIKGDDLGLFR